MVGHKRERVLGRVGRAVNAAARDFAREAAQLENGGGREAAAERLVEQQVEVVALDKDRVVVETAMRLDVAVAGQCGRRVGRAARAPCSPCLGGGPSPRCAAEGVGVANGGGRAATRGVANARRGRLEEGRPELDFIHFIASSRPSVRFCEVDLVPLVVLPVLFFLVLFFRGKNRHTKVGASKGEAG